MFFVTGIQGIRNPKEITNKRCFGYFVTEKEALQAVIQNTGNLHDHEYHYLVIEKVEQGVHPSTEETFWFSWENGWKGISKPEETNEFSNYAFG